MVNEGEMAKPSPAPIGFAVPSDAPPSYNQTMGMNYQQTYPQQPYQPSQHHQPGMPQVSHVTVVTTVIPPGPNPTHMVCPHCQMEIDSTVKTSPSLMAWLSGAVLAFLGCWMGCCLIPCCIDECLDRDHYCPNCKQYLGRYQR